jgi:hypothetical protein
MSLAWELLMLALIILLFVKPLFLLTLYRKSRIYQLLDATEVPKWLAPVKLFLRLTFLPWLVKHPRTLDAWVQEHLETVRGEFENDDIVRSVGAYVPLPLRIDDAVTGRLIEMPDAGKLAPLLGKKRTVLEVIGPGGAGKTSLAVAVGRWALEGPVTRLLAEHVMLPVLVSEETEEPARLWEVIRGKLAALLEEELEGEFFEALLQKKRVLVIVDGLSERLEKTRNAVRTIHSSRPVNAIIVTTRTPLRFAAGIQVPLYPQVLGSSTILHFMISLLQVAPNHLAFPTTSDQLELGSKLAQIIRPGNQELPVRPLLVKLFIEQAVKSGVSGLPNSIPDIYFEYLRGVNPQGAGVLNGMKHDDMLKAATALARVSLANDFVPKEFSRAAALGLLADQGWKDPTKLDPIQRLIDNGVLAQKNMGTDTLLRFLLDPIGEMLAAESFAKECGNDPTRWASLRHAIDAHKDRAQGLLTALKLVHQAYHSKLGWADWIIP